MSSQFDIGLSAKSKEKDHILIGSIVLLIGFGLVTLYSASYSPSQRLFKDGLVLISRQLQWGALGFVLFLLSAFVINLQTIRSLIIYFIFISIVLCILTFVPGIGIEKNGAARWIGKGSLTFQPSELVKIVLPFYLAHILDKKKDKLNVFVKGIVSPALIPPTLIIGIFCALIIRQNNFSTALFVVVNSLVILFLAGIKLRYFIGVPVVLLPLAVFLVQGKPHRLDRFLSFINPTDPLGSNYQVNRAMQAISSGGFWGRGIGQGTLKVSGVPEVHSDFIFSAFSEEAGFLGVVLFCILFAVFAFRGYRASMRNESSFYRLLGFGLVTMIVSQALLNIAVTVGALPPTGVPLPFVSAGGSSLVVTMIMAGLIINISRFSKKHSIAEDI